LSKRILKFCSGWISRIDSTEKSSCCAFIIGSSFVEVEEKKTIVLKITTQLRGEEVDFRRKVRLF